MDNELKNWRDQQKHLPEFMRDFHNCKDLFKAISEYIVCEDDHPANDVNWRQAHCYTIDVFLWFMAEHGYTLQRSRTKQDFTSLAERVAQMRELRQQASASVLLSGMAQQGKEGEV
tara:strand:+ start:784 stop:1131 length:348 start_codon:yes stop_codon:yes gene_type:complete